MSRTDESRVTADSATRGGATFRERLQPLLARDGFWLEVGCALVVSVCLYWLATDLGALPFWVDESIAVLPARSILSVGVPLSPFDLNYMAPQLEDGLWDPSAPLYRYSLAAFTALAGFSEATTRGLSVLLGALLLVPCHALVRRIYGASTAWLAVAFLVSLPIFAYEARQARHFTFVALMMATTFYWMLRSVEAPRASVARALWPVFMVACLLGHYVGYLVLPIVAATLLASRSLLLSRRFTAVYLGLGLVYGAILWRWGGTLPLLHDIGCHNRQAGCEPDPLFYPKILLDDLAGQGVVEFALDNVGRTASFHALVGIALPLALLLVGIGESATIAIRARGKTPQQVLLLAWLVLPLVLLSTRELKFQRYAFYVLPPLSVFIARGVVLASGWRPFQRFRQGALLVLAAVLIVGPMGRVVRTGHGETVAHESRLAMIAHRDPARGEVRSWLLSRQQGKFLRERIEPGDVAVTTFDDASLGYYSGHFVYGFLNSEHDDRFFLDLLAKTASQGATLWFVDMLPAYDECHTPGLEPRSIPCLEKYSEFYAACTPASPTFNPACQRLRVDPSSHPEGDPFRSAAKQAWEPPIR